MGPRNSSVPRNHSPHLNVQHPSPYFRKGPLLIVQKNKSDKAPKLSPAAIHSTCGCPWTVYTASTLNGFCFSQHKTTLGSVAMPLLRLFLVCAMPFQPLLLYPENLHTSFKFSSDPTPSKKPLLIPWELMPFIRANWSWAASNVPYVARS